jgi:tRNA dimethylallyltransferase
LAEVEALVSRGVLSSDMPAASAVGYRELLPIVERGEGSLMDAVTLIKRNSRRYAKRQMTWLRSMKDAEWIKLDDGTPDDAAAAILSLMSERGRPTR